MKCIIFGKGKLIEIDLFQANPETLRQIYEAFWLIKTYCIVIKGE
jgi:hypothetical protein